MSLARWPEIETTPVTPASTVHKSLEVVNKSVKLDVYLNIYIIILYYIYTVYIFITYIYITYIYIYIYYIYIYIYYIYKYI